MKTIIKHENLTWISLFSPSAEEVAEISKKYTIHPLVAEELISLTMRPKVDVYAGILYLILHFPFVTVPKQPEISHEIDFVIGKDFLITAHYLPAQPLEKFIQGCKTQESFRKQYFGKNASFLAISILKELYNITIRQLDTMNIKINKVEKMIFEGEEKKMVKEISMLKRDVLDFQTTLYPHESVLSSLEETYIENKKKQKDFFEKDFEHYLNTIIGEFTKIKNSIKNSKDTLETLRETNESLLSTKTNEVMKVLTIMAFITFPLMLLSSIFGMNTVNTPVVGIRGDFWIIAGAMLTATTGMFLYFKKKKWL
ncbi:magnesium transporter CorA family protein [Patescibacteria group bacterium]|nr:magnesium transporter CorA family protein [Patescibacteria group bacterium]MBU2633117.1 magnesium transporter CorA family protein [Patescibacteria group bacterium]